jgi:uncharacterized protein (DUF1810 family)
MHRRAFVQNLAAAAGAFTFRAAGSDALPYSIATNSQRLSVSADGQPFTFQTFLRVGNDWKPASLAENKVLVGPSFPFTATTTRRSDYDLLSDGTAMGEHFSYKWRNEISLVRKGENDWFRFRTLLHLPVPLRLQEGSRIEPQIILWLNKNSTLMEGQSGSWRRVEFSQPTRNSLGAPGNDLPAVYLLDNNEGVETILYFDMSDMAWMSFANLPRFLVYRCGMTSQLEAGGENQRFGVGLLANQASGNVLPAGDIRFTWWLLQRAVPDLLNQQQAVTRWMGALSPLFEENLAWPKCASSWADFAARTIADLQSKQAAQVEVNGHLGLRAYVAGTSELWTQPAADFELITVTDVLWPSLLYLRLHSNPPYQQEIDALLNSLADFYRADTHSISNNFKPSANERADSWYPFENALIKYPMIATLTGSQQLKEYFLDAFHTATEMAHHFHYLFPVYYRVANWQTEGAGTNYAVNGLYAWSAIIAHRLTGDDHFLEEARRAIEVLQTVPAERLFHEPQELAFGALAASELGLQEAATYLLSEQLRRFYWYSDPSQHTHDIRGMVQAAASILYPAFKENVEAILPWTGILKRGTPLETVLVRFMDQQRRNNFSFFEACSAQTNKTPSLPFIPFENLGTLELGGQTGKVGKEIYGAGECVWMYLMFEGLARVSDRELMLLNLDLLDRESFPPRQANFLLFNPTPQQRLAKIAFGEPLRPKEKQVEIPSGAIIRIATEG